MYISLQLKIFENFKNRFSLKTLLPNYDRGRPAHSHSIRSLTFRIRLFTVITQPRTLQHLQTEVRKSKLAILRSNTLNIEVRGD